MNQHSRFEKLGTILDSVLTESGYLTVAREAAMVERWPAIAGASLAAVSACERAEEGVLYVRVSSAPWRQELSYVKPALLEKIRNECATIRDIVFY